MDFPAEYSSWRDPHEGLWIDHARFRQLFLVLTPWGASEMGDALAKRCFRVSVFICHDVILEVNTKYSSLIAIILAITNFKIGNILRLDNHYMR